MVLIDLTTSGFASELVAFLAPYLNGEPASEDLVTRGPAAKLADLATKLVSDGSGSADADAVLKALVDALVKHTTDMPAEDMVAAYTLMWELINTNTAGDQPQLAHDLAKQMAAGLTAQPQDKPAARLSVYAHLYAPTNLPSHPSTCSLAMLYDAAGKANPTWRYDLLLPYVTFLGASGQKRPLPPASEVQRWLAAWGVSRAQRLAAYETCAQCALKLGGDAAAQQWLLLLLRECEGADAAELAKQRPSALLAVCAALRSPTQFQLDELAGLAAVRQLGASGAEAAHADASRLLSIFVSGSLADFKKFEQERPAALAALGLEPAAARRKMQLLTLVSLAQEAAGSELPFARIAAGCEVAEDAVEELVLDAIAADILAARIDETRAVVKAGRTLQRTFGPAQWKALHAELGAWRATIKAVVDVVSSSPVSV